MDVDRDDGLSCLEMEWLWGWLLTAVLAGISPTGYRFLRSKVLSPGYCGMVGLVQALVTAGEEKLAGCDML